MKALTHDFVVGRTLADVYGHVAAAIAGASRGAVAVEDVALTPAPSHTGSDLSFRCFELARQWKKNPAEIAKEMAAAIPPDAWIARAVAAGPYLNVELDRDAVVPRAVAEAREAGDAYGDSDREAGEVVMMEYVSPNTNKPLHLGHLRNGVLGRAVANLLASQGARVLKTSIVNDRGIHIAKSMLAYERWGEGATPESAGVKGDRFVGRLYVRFEQELQKEKETWRAEQELDKEAKDLDERFNESSRLLAAARDLLKRWEAGDAEARALWERMNGWVYAGFKETYDRLGLDFDKHYYESEIYEGGKEIIFAAVEKGIFKRAPNGAVIAPLSEHGKLQDKAVLRGDGTGLYVTQDIHLAAIKFKEFGLTRSLYCIGSEQDYYMQQLFAILKLLGFPWADGLYHLSYGMVYLPEGKMKSREGRVVDADDLMDGMRQLAREAIRERFPDLEGEELDRRAMAIGLAAMTFHFLAVGKDTEIHFDPASSLAFEGKTGPYLQYAYARVSSILRKAGDWQPPETLVLGEDVEWRILVQVMLFPVVVADAAESYDPMRLSSYLIELAQLVNTFYHDHPVLQSGEPVRSSRLALLAAFRVVVGNGLRLLAIEALEEM
ncbi:MAG TPA: arginine--tRNA ligase [Thermoanaerobaculia bacterium]|jgi:arginyl-tRNA synthetase